MIPPAEEVSRSPEAGDGAAAEAALKSRLAECLERDRDGRLRLAVRQRARQLVENVCCS